MRPEEIVEHALRVVDLRRTGRPPRRAHPALRPARRAAISSCPTRRPISTPSRPAQVTAEYAKGGIRLGFRTRSEAARFFDGLDLVPPGLVTAPEWFRTPGHRPPSPVASVQGPPASADAPALTDEGPGTSGPRASRGPVARERARQGTSIRRPLMASTSMRPT